MRNACHYCNLYHKYPISFFRSRFDFALLYALSLPVGHQDGRGGAGVRPPPGRRQHHHLRGREPTLRQHIGRQESPRVGVVSVFIGRNIVSWHERRLWF